MERDKLQHQTKRLDEVYVCCNLMQCFSFDDEELQ